LKKGTELLGEERFQDALIWLNRAVEEQPKSTEALALRARTLAEMGKYSRALEDYTKLIGFKPDNVGFLAERAMVYLQLKDYANAAADLGQVISLGHDVMAYYTRGWSYSQLGEHEKAIDDFTSFIAKTQDESSRADAYFCRGNEYYELKKYQSASEDFEKADKIDAERGVVSSGASRGMSAGGKKDVSILPDYAKTYYRSGMVLCSLNQHAKAVENFTRAIGLNPGNPEFYKARAESYKQLGQAQKAKEDEDKATIISLKNIANQVQQAAGATQTGGGQENGKPGANAISSQPEVDLANFESHLVQLEKKFLDKSYPDELIPERLARLEQKLFGRTQSGNLKHRLDALMLETE
jgi:tetratricopeptide (TPR) repeat protein